MDAQSKRSEVLKKLGASKGRRAKRWVTRVVFTLGLVAIVAGVIVWRMKAGRAKQPNWVFAPVERTDLRETVTATGTLSPLDSVEVGAEVSGRVLKVNVQINDQVKEGQVLVEIDPEQANARVEESAAQLRSAQASYRNATATVKESELKADRLRELAKRGLASAQELEAAEATLERARASVSTSSAQVTVSQAGVKSAKTSQSKTRVVSPIDGIVLARSVEPGQTVTAGFQTPIMFTLARDLTQMQLKVDVDEADVGKVKEGLRASFVVDAYPRRQFSSQVVRLNNLPKAGTTVITYEALLSVDNSARLLRPGMTATSTIVTAEKKGVVTVPNAALRFEPPGAAPSATAPRAQVPIPGFGRPTFGGGRGGPRPAGSAGGAPAQRGRTESVYIVKDGKLTKVSVRVGGTDSRRTEIESAELQPGAQVVIDVEEPAE